LCYSVAKINIYFYWSLHFFVFRNNQILFLIKLSSIFQDFFFSAFFREKRYFLIRFYFLRFSYVCLFGLDLICSLFFIFVFKKVVLFNLSFSFFFIFAPILFTCFLFSHLFLLFYDFLLIILWLLPVFYFFVFFFFFFFFCFVKCMKIFLICFFFLFYFSQLS